MRERLPDHHETGTFADRTGDAGLIAAASELLEALQSLQAFVAVTIGRGPNAKIPDTIPTPLGIQVNIGAIMRDADAAVAKAEGTLLRPTHRQPGDWLEKERNDDLRDAIDHINALKSRAEAAERERDDALATIIALQAERDFASARADCFTLEIERLEANAELLHARLAAGANPTRLKPEDVEWVVNDNAELGVKIGDQFFFLYKGRSLVYGLLNEDPTQPPEHDAGGPMHWRPVFKREFGECAHPINYADLTKIGTVSLDDSDDWKELPPAVLAKVKPHDQ